MYAEATARLGPGPQIPADSGHSLPHPQQTVTCSEGRGGQRDRWLNRGGAKAS